MWIKNLFSSKYFSIIISLLIFWIAVFYILSISLNRTDGHFLYTLDDSYIHMAMAKNFITTGVWGITHNEFSSCSSSPLWTFLISVFYFVFGVKEIIPFILNIIAASFTAFISFRFLIKFTQNNLILTLALLSLLFFGPFVSVVFTGLEHSLYTMLIVLTAVYFYKILSGVYQRRDLYFFYALIVLLSLTRYEGMFFAFAIFLVFLFRKKLLYSFLTLAFCFLPIAILGLFSISKGWYFFPNSVVLKSQVDINNFSALIASIFNPRFFELLLAYRRILLLLLISILMLILFRKDKEKREIKSLLFIFIIFTLLHIQFAKLGSLLRYEMHIIVFGIFVNVIAILIILVNKDKKIKNAVYTILLILMIPFSYSAYNAAKDVPVASTNIYQMQYQMSRFINKYYNKGTIALNDIGAVNYYCDIKCIDMWGLANKEIGKLRKTDTYDANKMYEINKQSETDIAIVFDSWFEKYGGLPKEWYQVGKWTIPYNVTCGADSVTFYAVNELSYKRLIENLKNFSKELQYQVKENGAYIRLRDAKLEWIE